jgi:rSAM/selenodomain-associated transferase 2
MPAEQISVIIPVLDEADYIGRVLKHLQAHADEAVFEIIVVDGGSKDATVEIVATFDRVTLLSMKDTDDVACRATQMNFGAAHAQGSILWFVHADTLPPAAFSSDLVRAVQRGKQLGGYAFDFESNRFLLRLNSWFTRFNWSFTRGGDQTLFITRATWEALGGYRAHFVVMEEYDLIDRAFALGYRYHRLKGAVKVSARKYDENSYLQVQRANLAVFRMYKSGAQPEAIRARYYAMLKHPKDAQSR